MHPEACHLSLILQDDINQFLVNLHFTSEHGSFTLPGSCFNCLAESSKSIDPGSVTLQHFFHKFELLSG